MSNYTWTGEAKSISIWGERVRDVGELKPGDEFELFGWRWRVERQARRTTFARGVSYEWKDCRIQLKKSKCVSVPHTVLKAESA